MPKVSPRRGSLYLSPRQQPLEIRLARILRIEPLPHRGVDRDFRVVLGQPGTYDVERLAGCGGSGSVSLRDGERDGNQLADLVGRVSTRGLVAGRGSSS